MNTLLTDVIKRRAKMIFLHFVTNTIAILSHIEHSPVKMYMVQIHSLASHAIATHGSSSTQNIILEISSDGQPSRSV
jgi:hypothetical protein